MDQVLFDDAGSLPAPGGGSRRRAALERKVETLVATGLDTSAAWSRPGVVETRASSLSQAGPRPACLRQMGSVARYRGHSVGAWHAEARG
jgi:hypothetical protein